MKNVQNKHIVVIGAARSGAAAAVLLNKKGADVFVTDSQAIAPNVKKQLQQHDIPFEENGHTKKAKSADFVVISPGVPTQSALPQFYLKAGKEVFSEIEVASWFYNGSIIAVTGSNGKTTVTHWLDHIWKRAGRDHVTAGNVGAAFSASVDDTVENRDAILEVSSFQLDHIQSFRPKVSLLLNITPDHLDRYEYSLDKYAESKLRIAENQLGDDWLIYHYDDPIINEQLVSLKKKVNDQSCSLFHQPGRCQRGLLSEMETSSLN